jgi:histone-lysine N-methyltransferase SETMAR
MLNHDKCTGSFGTLCKEILDKHNIPLLYHPPYSPDLSSTDSFLFSKEKNTKKGKKFHKMPEIIQSVTQELNITEYQICFNKWHDHWNDCVQSGEDSFERTDLINRAL